MSLDVYLQGPVETVECVCSCCDNVHTRETRPSFYEANVTHNLTAMADEAGIYRHLWRPDELGITKARELIEPLCAGVALMKSDPPRFLKHNPSNGWGSYERFVPWIEEYLQACEDYPNAEIHVSR